ncbi:hypothetical protein DPMN_052315 [Dreissena polymorpha]|uniref:Uncharacterized protein n=1 Tax=Dreissena polymorpha TaxID=45954 RepID=A0A9D4HR57_DREPO|nr:hypothetical protein DPMN_052315 [Dreissena polymorpha]
MTHFPCSSRSTALASLCCWLTIIFPTYIADNAFRGMEGRITSLNLSCDCFTTLPVGVGVLYKLRAFQILDNPLQNLNEDVIAILGQTLTNFYFDMASMQNWRTELHFLRELEDLYIRNIPFEQLSTSAFYGLNNLRSLTIDHSLLRKISTAYCDLKKL